MPPTSPMARVLSVAAASMLLLGACGGGGSSIAWAPIVPAPAPAPPEPPPAKVAIAGAVDRPAAFTAADLATRPAVTQTVSYISGRGEQTRTYVGTSMWSLLEGAGIQAGAAHPDFRRDHAGYVLASAADGYQSVFSLGELIPAFGNRASLVAYQEISDGKTGPLPAADGPFRATAPQDVRGGRYVSQLTRLDVRPHGAAPWTQADPGGRSRNFVLGGQVVPAGAKVYDVAAIKALVAPVTRTVGTDTFEGVSLWALLDRIGLQLPDVKNPANSLYVVATGLDGYRTVVALGEINPSFGNAEALIAYRIGVNGGALEDMDDARGAMRLVMVGDAGRGRYVSRLAALDVLSAKPVEAAVSGK